MTSTYVYRCRACIEAHGLPSGTYASTEIGGCMTCKQLEVVHVFRIACSQLQRQPQKEPAHAKA